MKRWVEGTFHGTRDPWVIKVMAMLESSLTFSHVNVCTSFLLCKKETAYCLGKRHSKLWALEERPSD